MASRLGLDGDLLLLSGRSQAHRGAHQMAGKDWNAPHVRRLPGLPMWNEEGVFTMRGPSPRCKCGHCDRCRRNAHARDVYWTRQIRATAKYRDEYHKGPGFRNGEPTDAQLDAMAAEWLCRVDGAR